MSIISNFPGGGGSGSSPKVDSIEVTGSYTQNYYSGDAFQTGNDFLVMASFKLEGMSFGNPTDVTDQVVFIPEGGNPGDPLTDGVTKVIVKYTDNTGKSATAELPVTVTHRLVSITATHNDSGVTYEYEGTLNTSKVTVTAHYTDDATANVSSSATIVDAATAFNAVGTKTFTVKYRDDSLPAGQYKETTFQVTVHRKTINQPSWKANLTYTGSSQSVNDVSKWNNWAGASQATIAAASGDTGKISSTDVGTFNVVFTCTANYRFGNTGGNDVLTCTKSWTMDPLGLDVPTIDWNPTSKPYNGQGQYPTFNYTTASTTVTVGGDNSAKTNVGNYSTSFTLKDTKNYKWKDNTNTAKSLAWSITQVEITVSLSQTALAIGGGAAIEKTANITYNPNIFDGVAPTLSPASITGLATYSATKDKLTVRGNGTTAIAETTVTLTFTNTTNCKIKANPTIKVSATYWSWDTASITDDSKAPVADAAWWTSLKSFIAGATADDLKNKCLGLQVKVTIPFTITGNGTKTTTSNTHLLRCVGYNCDRDKSNPSKNTLTFHSSDCIGTSGSYYGASNGLWNNSYMRTFCQDYKTAFENTYGTGIIVTTSQKTATATNSSQSGTATAQDETVFLPSDAQMGYPKGMDYSNGRGYAASYDEFDANNSAKTAYQYYTDYTKRIKKLSGSAKAYWERSLYYNNTNYACIVYNDGKPYSNSYDYSDGFAPAFVV